MDFRRVAKTLTILTLMLTGWLTAAADSISIAVPKREGNWVKQLIANGFRINDPSINYPRFARFCVKVYNWGDKTFNSYDPDYVVGTGKNWKLTGKSFNWGESAAMYFTSKSQIRMYSNIYADLGTSIGFMAVAYSYTADANKLFGNPTNYRKNSEYSFTCSLFSGEIQMAETHGGMNIQKFGEMPMHHHMDFNGVREKSINLNFYYFVNHRRYSQAAAYCYSKYQLKSAGSPIFGINYYTQSYLLDFSQLPTEMLDYLPGDYTNYAFHYKSFNIIAGYAYNWVLSPRRWLINATILPSLGYKHSYEDSTDGDKRMLALGTAGRMSAVYNQGILFAALTARFDGRIHFGNGYTFFNSLESLTATVGIRF